MRFNELKLRALIRLLGNRRAVEVLVRTRMFRRYVQRLFVQNFLEKNMFNTILGLLKSKVFWYNAGLIVVYAIDAVSQLDIIKNNPDYLAIAVAAGNILLRLITKQSLADKWTGRK